MNKFKPILKDYVFIILGSLILAIGINVFTLPNKISAGGITAVGTIFLYTLGIKLSLTNLVCNGILFFFGYKNLGKYAVIQTISGIVLLSFFLEITSSLPVYTDNEMIAAISGGVFMGMGVGLVVKQGASTGGSDFAGLILKKFLPHISLAKLIMSVDFVIIFISGLVFKSFTVTFYSLLALFVSSTVTDKIITFGDDARMIQIFSTETEKISDHILKAYERGVTGIRCIGMYSGKESVMLMCIIKAKELPRYLKLIKELDRHAFVTIGEVHEVLGEGFKTM